MKKRQIFNIIFLIAIVTTIVVAISVGGNNTMGYSKSSVQVDVTYKDGTAEIATDMDFRYDSIHTESELIKVELDTQSVILISDFVSTSECNLYLYDISQDKELWSTVVENERMYKNMVEDVGTYVLKLEMKTGSGNGTISISNLLEER